MPTILIILSLVIGVSGGTSLVATQAQPGDVLFPVKVNINEEVRGFLTLTSQGKAEWDVARAERRLEEVEELAADGMLTADARAQVETNFKAHAGRVQERIDSLTANGNIAAAASVSARLTSSLDAHAEILKRLAAKEADSRADLNAMLAVVHAEQVGADAAEEKSENAISADANVITEAAVEGKAGAAEKKIEATKELLADMEGVLKAEVIAEAKAELQAAEAAFAQGNAQLEAKSFSAAFLSFQEAQRIAQESKVLLEARKNLNLDVMLDARAESHVDGDTDDDDEDEDEEKDDDEDARAKVTGILNGNTKLSF